MTKIYEDKKIGKVTYNELLIALAGGQYNVESITREDGKEELRITDWNYVPPEPAPTFDRVFGNNSWETISAISAQISANSLTSAEVAETYGWNLGDIKQETLTTGEVIELQIIGFNHDDKSDGTGKAGMTLQMVNCLATRYSMNTENTNAGGWGASLMRTSTLPTIKATLSSELQSVIKLVDKKAANGGSTNYTATVTTSDDLFLPAGIEIFGSESSYGYAQDGVNEGTQYEYWQGKGYADRIKSYDSDADGVPDTAISWRDRSSGSSYTKYFCGVDNTGYAFHLHASTANGISLALCI